jgi:hypothetical protein
MLRTAEDVDPATWAVAKLGRTVSRTPVRRLAVCDVLDEVRLGHSRGMGHRTTAVSNGLLRTAEIPG